jgi:hypothetical protein
MFSGSSFGVAMERLADGVAVTLRAPTGNVGPWLERFFAVLAALAAEPSVVELRLTGPAPTALAPELAARFFLRPRGPTGAARPWTGCAAAPARGRRLELTSRGDDERERPRPDRCRGPRRARTSLGSDPPRCSDLFARRALERVWRTAGRGAAAGRAVAAGGTNEGGAGGAPTSGGGGAGGASEPGGARGGLLRGPLAELVCARAGDCGCEAILPSGDFDEALCVAGYTERCLEAYAPLADAVTLGLASIDAGRAAECIDLLTTLTPGCERPRGTVTFGLCPAWFSSDVALGEPCTFPLCAEGAGSATTAPARRARSPVRAARASSVCPARCASTASARCRARAGRRVSSTTSVAPRSAACRASALRCSTRAARAMTRRPASSGSSVTRPALKRRPRRVTATPRAATSRCARTSRSALGGWGSASPARAARRVRSAWRAIRTPRAPASRCPETERPAFRAPCARRASRAQWTSVDCAPLPGDGEACGFGAMGPTMCEDGLGCLAGTCGALPGEGAECTTDSRCAGGARLRLHRQRVLLRDEEGGRRGVPERSGVSGRPALRLLRRRLRGRLRPRRGLLRRQRMRPDGDVYAGRRRRLRVRGAPRRGGVVRL